MTIEQYINNIDKKYKLGNADEQTLRSDLQQLIESLVPDISATTEPIREACGAPDYILMKNDIPLGFIETTDLSNHDLASPDKNNNKAKFDRFKNTLNNILFTNYLDFYLFREGQLVTKITVGELQNGTVRPLPDNFTDFTYLLRDFCAHIDQTIRSSRKLAEIIANKTRLLSEVIEKALIIDDNNQENSTLKDQMQGFKQYLGPNINPKDFADIYAQTIAYGMFTARLHDPTLPSFSRQEAAELIPKFNPFLFNLFGYIASPEIDNRLKWLVDNLTEVFLACNIAELLQNQTKATKTEDSINHFYETFLGEYDARLRKIQGILYTPQPVANFVVQAVDEILKSEFNLTEGLAPTVKINQKEAINSQAAINQIAQVSQEIIGAEAYPIQILDLTAGASSFVTEVINHIHKRFVGGADAWNSYLETYLLPNLKGFESQMASFTMAHLKLDYLLSKTGYKPSNNQRFPIYLTNLLAAQQPGNNNSFTNWLSTETQAANKINTNSSIMCVLGNLPFSNENTNASVWINSLMEDYKTGLSENEDILDEDYIKFIRYSQDLIDKSGNGILAFVSNNNFIDDITHRQMRKHLLESFDKIYILDLHGNGKKKETAADGSPDQNVFDVIQGVSINVFVKTGKKKADELSKVYHFDLYGTRAYKSDFLNENTFKTIKYQEVRIKAPLYFLVQKEYGRKEIFNQGFKINDLFLFNTAGVITEKTAFVIGENGHTLVDKIKGYFKINPTETQKKYLVEENGGWKMIEAKQPASGLDESTLVKISYRPFDEKHIYQEKSAAESTIPKKMPFSGEHNINLFLSKQLSSENYAHLFITDKIVVDSFLSKKTKEKGYSFPLYLYSETNDQITTDPIRNRKPNLNLIIVNQIAENLGLKFFPEKGTEGEVCFADSPEVRPEFKQSFTPVDLLDYIYAVLHSSSYREKYKQFLKLDFPRVPYPKNANTFWQLVESGGKLRQTHLLQSDTVAHHTTQFPVVGSNVVNKLKYQDGHVYINKTQYFANVPAAAWNLYIGSYQPAQKWLKDRKGQTLSFEDILHYQKIIAALSESARLMREINQIVIEEPTFGLLAD